MKYLRHPDFKILLGLAVSVLSSIAGGVALGFVIYFLVK
jgi:hypothetical protein